MSCDKCKFMGWLRDKGLTLWAGDKGLASWAGDKGLLSPRDKGLTSWVGGSPLGIRVSLHGQGYVLPHKIARIQVAL